MIRRWKIGNFKSIRETVDLPLAPLTIFAGPNSSGKSSIIKSILAVAQSLISPVWEEPLVLNGRFVSLGNLEDVLHYGYEHEQMDIGFTMQTSPTETVSLDAGIEAVEVTNARVKGRLRARLEFSELVAQRKNISDRIGIMRQGITKEVLNSELQQTSETIREQIRQGLFDYALVEPKPSELSTERHVAVPLATSLNNILPGRMLYRVWPDVRDVTQDIRFLADVIRDLGATKPAKLNVHDRERELHEGVKAAFQRVLRRIRPAPDPYIKILITVIEDILATRRPLTVRDCLNSLDIARKELDLSPFTRLVQDLSRRLTGSIIEIQDIIDTLSKGKSRTELEVQLLPANYAQLIDRVRQTLGGRIFYLGPLRDDPRVIYAIPSQPNQRDVGLKGEFTAAMLDMHGHRKVKFPLPPVSLPESFPGVYKVIEAPLANATKIWLERMGLAEHLDSSETARVGYNLTVQPPGLQRNLDLTNVGVGVSQVLPTIVMALLAPPDSILVFEQPEVHLHPKVQSVLGDFFLGMVACGKQCLVETHSEHLINRIRRRIAEADEAWILEQTKVYFVVREGPVSKYHPVLMNEYGAIPDWPQGFFDEVEEEATLIMRAADSKYRRRRSSEKRRDGE